MFFQPSDPCFLGNKDYPGNGLGTHTVEGSSVKCQERCQQTDGCGAFSYATGTYDGVHGKRIRQRCFLKIKGTLPELTDQENVISGPKHCLSKS